MLSERQKLVLIAIIEEYVKTNEPVGSFALSKRPELNFSTATLRNEMAQLEEMGFLEKTHTSSGRIPSEKGYRFYVETIMRKSNEKDANACFTTKRLNNRIVINTFLITLYYNFNFLFYSLQSI